jgi:hypothetical protein
VYKVKNKIWKKQRKCNYHHLLIWKEIQS